MTTTSQPAPRPAATAVPAAVPGLPPLQGTILAALWETGHPATVSQLAARLGHPAPDVVRGAVSSLRTAGLVTIAQRAKANHYTPAHTRDSYLTTLITAALNQARDPAAVIRAALHTSPTR